MFLNWNLTSCIYNTHNARIKESYILLFHGIMYHRNMFVLIEHLCIVISSGEFKGI